MTEMEDRWLSINEICKHLGVSNDTVYKWISKHDMPAHRLGRLWKFKKDEVDTWVKAGGTSENSKKPKPVQDNRRYRMSFTTGSLFFGESVKLAELFLACQDWDVVKDQVITGNLLQARTENTSKRICREVLSRLKTLELHELELLVHSNTQEQKYCLWVAICRRYTFIADFAIEVLRERFIDLKKDLNYEDFNSFFNKRSEWHPELEEIQSATRNKLCQVLFRIMREVNLLTTNNTINAAILSPRILETIHRGNKREVLFFPVFESDVRGVEQ